MKKKFLALITVFFALRLFSQNVGVGIATPGAPLHIYNSSTEELLRIQGNNPYLGFRTLAGTLKSYVQGYGDDILVGTAGGNPTGRLLFYNNNAANMTILPNGNVGIGTSIPDHKLTVQTIGIGYGVIHTNGTMRIGTYLGSGAGWLGTQSNHPLNFFTNDQQAQLTLLQNGNFGLGTTNPVAKFQINSNNEALRLRGNNQYMSFYDGSDNYRSYIWNNAGNIEIGTDYSNSNGEVSLKTKGVQGLTVQSNGTVKIGPLACTIQPEFGVPFPVLSVFGAMGIKKSWGDNLGEWVIGYSTTFGGANTNEDLLLVYNGGFKARIDDVDGEYTSNSDYRLKENFENYKPVLDGIKRLSVFTYHYKADKTSKRSFGLVAQNLKQYFPELVSGNEKEGYLGIAYGKTGVLAIKAIQEQQEIIEAQQKKMDSIVNEISFLKEQNKKLMDAIDKLIQNK